MYYSSSACREISQMKLFSLVLCVGMLWITTASKELPQPHHLHKRQDDSSEACDQAVLNDVCTSGYYQDYATLLLECNGRETAKILQKGCQSSPSGTFCALINNDELGPAVTTACGSSPTTCSSDCQDLLTTTRADLGCCITLFNYTDAPAFNNSLWSLCNVEVVSDQECASAGPIQLPDSITVDPTCTTNNNSFSTRSQEITCRAQYMESLFDTIMEFEECDISISDINDLCSINEEGEYCQLVQDDTAERFIITDASTNCADTDICDPLCTQSLNNITSCCFITQNNGTLRYDWLSYEFWSRCGLDSPGFCETKFTNGAVILKAPGICTIFAVSLVVLLY